MRGMSMPRSRLLIASSLAFALAAPLAGRNQDAAALQGSDPPANGIWLDSLDLEPGASCGPGAADSAAQPAPPLIFKLGGVTYPHAVPLRTDADITIDLNAARRTRFVSMIGVDDGAPPAPRGR